MPKLIDHKTGISIALAITMVGAAGSFWVMKAQVADLRDDVVSVQDTLIDVREDVAFIKGSLEQDLKMTRQ